MARTRRAFLATATGTIAVTFAGCTGDGDGGGDGGDGSGTTAEDGGGVYGNGAGTTTEDGDGGDTTADGEATTDGETATDADATTGGGTTTGGATTTGGETTTGGGQTAREAYPDYNWSSLDDATPEETDSITLQGFAFVPKIAKVSPGTTVSFTNEDGSPHTVTIPKLGVDKQLGGNGGTATVTFETAGEYGMVCTFHPPDMLGKVVVE